MLYPQLCLLSVCLAIRASVSTTFNMIFSAFGHGVFNKMCLLQVITKDDSGWWFVEVDGVKGWAPSTYMQPQEAKVSISTLPVPVAKSPKPARPARPPSTKNNPKSQSKSAHLRKGVSTTVINPTEMSGPSAANNGFQHLKLKKPNVTTNSTAVPEALVAQKPIKPKKPVLKTSSQSAISNHTYGDEQITSQVSVAELRMKLTSLHK